MKKILFILQSRDTGCALDNLDAALTCAALGQHASVLLLNEGVKLLNTDEDPLREKLGMLNLYGIETVYVASTDATTALWQDSSLSPAIDSTALVALGNQEVRHLISEQDSVFAF